MYGMLIGTTMSSVVLFIFRIIPITTIGMIIILYLYSIVGGITGCFIHKKVEKNSSKCQPVESNKITSEEVNNQEDKANTPKNRTDNPKPIRDITDIVVYKKTLDEIDSLKKTSNLLKSLMETRKKLEELRKENNSILEDIAEKMDDKRIEITKNYQSKLTV